MTRRKSPYEQRLKVLLAVIHAHEKHYGSTTQREEAAADLGMDLSEFREALDEARRRGFDVDRKPRPG